MSRSAKGLLVMGAVALAGCWSSEPAEISQIPDEQPVVVVSATPLRGQALAVVLEPRMRHNQVHGVMVGDGTSDNAGPAALVHVRAEAPDRAAVVTSALEPGPKRIERVGDALLVWTHDDHHGGFSAAVYGPKPTPAIAVAVFSADALAPRGQRTFAPGLEQPVGLAGADFVVDLPRSGHSDSARDVRLVAHALDPKRPSRTLFEARGYQSTACRGGASAAVAFEPALGVAGSSESVRVVSVAASGDRADVAGASITGYRLRVDVPLSCSSASRWVAVPVWRAKDGVPCVLHVDAEGGFVARVLERAATPAFLSDDGEGVAARADGAAETQVVPRAGAPSAVPGSALGFAGDRLYFRDRVVDLTTGEVTLLARPLPACRGVAPWGRRGIACVANVEGSRRMGVWAARAEGRVDLVAERSDLDAYSWLDLLGVEGDTAWVLDHDRPQTLAAIDLARGSLVLAAPRPACDTGDIERYHGCTVH